MSGDSSKVESGIDATLACHCCIRGMRRDTSWKQTKLAKPKNTPPPILKQHIVLNVAQLKD